MIPPDITGGDLNGAVQFIMTVTPLGMWAIQTSSDLLSQILPDDEDEQEQEDP